jgi:SSS family solute:Na+ symporter
MPGWVVGMSVLGTFLSSITFLGLPASTYRGNWYAVVFGMALPVAAWVATCYFVPLYRTAGRLSAYELLEERFGYWARIYANLSYLALQMVRVGIVLLLVAFAVAPLLDSPARLSSPPIPSDDSEASPRAGKPAAPVDSAGRVSERAGGLSDAFAGRIIAILVGLGLLVIVYDTLGGIRAVIWTDVIQVVILVIGAAWCLIVLMADTADSPLQFFNDIPAEKLSLGNWTNWEADGSARFWNWEWDWVAPSVLVMLMYAITENLRNYGTDQQYVQRMLAARDQSAARRSIWIGALSYLPLSVLFCMIGTALSMYYSRSAMLPDGTLADQVFPHFIRTELPAPVAGLVIAAILAAAMSTVDSSLNAGSTVILVDIVRPLRRGPGRVPDIWIARSATILLGVLGTTTAVGLFLAFGQTMSKTIIDLWWALAGAAGGGMFGLFLLAWLFPRTPSWAALVAVLLSFPVLAWGMLSKGVIEKLIEINIVGQDTRLFGFVFPLNDKLVGVAAMLVVLLVGAAATGCVRAGWIAPNPRALGRQSGSIA